jgi:low temperature requirement protein LtrA
MSTAGIHVAGKRVGFLELFFDLVFVFAVTQLVGLLHEDHSAAGWGRAGLMLWLVWWAWSQYAWSGNAVDLDTRPARLAVLVASGAMLVAAAAIPEAYGTHVWWFAAPYAAVRLIGLGLYWFGVTGVTAHRQALRTYVPIALISPVLGLIGSFAEGDARLSWWGAAVLVDLASALSAGRGAFEVDPAHFAERHGLIVIIALGESVVAMGATASEVGLRASVVLVVALAFATVAAMWWGYFDWVNAAAEARLASEPDHRRRSTLARDLFTFGHLPIVAGTILFAVAVEEALLHPTDPMSMFATTAATLGPIIYLAGFVVGNLRATGQLLATRAIGIVAVATIGLAAGTRADVGVTLGLMAAASAALAATESIQRPLAN